MSKVTLQFQFTKNIPAGQGAANIIQVSVSGQYYPNQCSLDGLSYDIEEVHEVKYDNQHCDITGAFQIAQYNDDKFFQDIEEATIKHIQYLLKEEDPEVEPAHYLQINGNLS